MNCTKSFVCMYIVVEFVGLLTRGLVGMVDNLNNY